MSTLARRNTHALVSATHMSTAFVLSSLLPIITITGLWIFLRENRIHNWIYSDEEEQSGLAFLLFALLIPFQGIWIPITNCQLGHVRIVTGAGAFTLWTAWVVILLNVAWEAVTEDWGLVIFVSAWFMAVQAICFVGIRKAMATKAQATSEKAPAVALERLEAQA